MTSPRELQLHDNGDQNRGQQVAEKSGEMAHKAADLLVPANTFANIKARLLGSPEQNRLRKELRDQVVETALQVRKETAEAATCVTTLAIDCQAQIARDELLIQHRHREDDLHGQADKALVTAATQILEQKAEQIEQLRRLDADPELIAEAIAHIEQMSLNAAQDLINLNTKARSQH